MNWTLADALAYGKGVERPFLCPVHGDSRPSASVNVVKGWWYCYTCGAKGTLTGEDALVEPDYAVLQQWFDQKIEESRVYPESWLSRWDAGPVHPYWLERVGEQAARHFRLGSDADTESVTYPLRDSAGAVLGVVRRNLGEGGPKYLYPRGADVGHLLFGYTPEARRTVFLVEGAIDAMALWRAGVDAFAIYGSRLSQYQINLIDRIDPEFVVSAYDNDTAGWHAHYDTERAFKHRMVARLTWPKAWGKDVDEIGQDRLKTQLDSLAHDGVVWVDSTACRSVSSSEKKLVVQRSTRPSATTSPRRTLRIRLQTT